NALTTERAAHGNAPASPSSQPVLMTKAMFAPHLHTTFAIKTEDAQTVGVELVELHDRATAHKGAAQAERECFALTFRAPAHRALKQNTYRIEHRALGQFDLFVAPMKSARHGQVYEAIINHARA
ncbi:MAG TPA: hypothetical protein VE775_09700, partial [Pyrinomonadaceae bacterium]|nr:hypothetical protein [Pyrinomonadaceae bacterium]